MSLYTCQSPGAVGALLRREGLYSSHLSDWRRKFNAGGIEALREKQRGPTPSPDTAVAARLAQLEREKAALAQRLAQAELIIEIQKKVSQLLGLPPVDGGSR